MIVDVRITDNLHQPKLFELTPYESCFKRNQSMSFGSLALLFTAKHQKLPGMLKNHQGLPRCLCINPNLYLSHVFFAIMIVSYHRFLEKHVWMAVRITSMFLNSCTSFNVHIQSQQPFFFIHHQDELL